MSSRISSVREAIEKTLHDEKQPWTKYFVLFEEKTGVKRTQLFIGLVGFLAFYLVFGYGSQLLCNLIGFAYPAYCSMKALETRQKEDDTKWLTYWVVFATFSVAEYFSNAIVNWIPVYWLLKCVFLVWCFLPFSYNGSNFIYQRYIRPHFLKHQGDVDGLLNEVGGKGARDEADRILRLMLCVMEKFILLKFKMDVDLSDDKVILIRCFRNMQLCERMKVSSFTLIY